MLPLPLSFCFAGSATDFEQAARGCEPQFFFQMRGILRCNETLSYPLLLLKPRLVKLVHISRTPRCFAAPTGGVRHMHYQSVYIKRLVFIARGGCWVLPSDTRSLHRTSARILGPCEVRQFCKLECLFWQLCAQTAAGRTASHDVASFSTTFPCALKDCAWPPVCHHKPQATKSSLYAY